MFKEIETTARQLKNIQFTFITLLKQYIDEQYYIGSLNLRRRIIGVNVYILQLFLRKFLKNRTLYLYIYIFRIFIITNINDNNHYSITIPHIYNYFV